MNLRPRGHRPLDHNHPPVNAFNRTGQRFLWSDTTVGGQITLFRWDPPAGYTPVLTLAIDPSYSFRYFLVEAFSKEYPLPCGCTLINVFDGDIHTTET